MPEDSKPAATSVRPHDYGGTVGNTLDLVQAAIYLVAAILLVVLAIMAFLVIIGDMYDIVSGSMNIQAIDIVLSDILVVFVITGLVQTLIVYVKSHAIDPWLVLSVGLTAIIRRVLIFGAKETPYEEVALTTALLLVIIMGLYLVGRGRQPAGKRE